jgi:DNA-binding response OmpR family regulator
MNTALAENNPVPLHTITVGELQVIPDACSVTWKGTAVLVSAGSVALIAALAERQGLFVQHEILRKAFRPSQFHAGSGPTGYKDSLKVTMRGIRAAFLAVDADFDRIETQYGFGYRWRV